MCDRNNDPRRKSQNRIEIIWKRMLAIFILSGVMALVILGLLVRDRIQNATGPTYLNIGLGFGFVVAAIVVVYVSGRFVKGVISRLYSGKS
jgi:hypothetical protein